MFIAFTLECKQESESKTLKVCRVGVYSAEAQAGAESESKISDSVHLYYFKYVLSTIKIC